MTRPRSGWPSPVNLDPARGGWPAALMPGRKQGWPRGVNTSADPAENLLSQAVGWWDAAYYTAGDRFLRNRGVAGELLDMRLGSALAANSNDPLWLGPEATGYVYLDTFTSATGNYLSVPDENALDITGDLDVRTRVLPQTWNLGVGSEYVLMSKWASASGATQRGFILALRPSGVLRLALSQAGTSGSNYDSTASIPASSGVLWCRATYRASDRRIQFFTSIDGSSWTQLGADVTATETSIYANTAEVQVGGFNNGTGSQMVGRVYRAQVLNGIDGTTVLDVDCDVLTSGSATSFTATTGQTVTINRATSGRKTVAMPARGRGGRACFLLGTDDYFECVDNWQHQLLNFGQGDSFTAIVLARQWGTPVATVAYLWKSGWYVGNNSTSTQVRVSVTDGTNTTVLNGSPGPTLGVLSAWGLIADRTRRILQSFSDAGILGSSSTVNVGSIRDTNPLRIGRSTNFYQDFEFTGAAVFRRILSTDEISAIVTYYRNRGY